MTGVTGAGEAAGGRPGLCLRIVEFTVSTVACSRGAARGQHLSVRQKGRGVESVRLWGASGKGPGAALRIVKFRAEMIADHEDPTPGEQSGGGRLPALMQTAGHGPGLSYGIVKLGAGQDGIIRAPPRDGQHLSIGQ